VTAPVGLGLARVTVAAPKRRIDVAVPDSALVAELLPHLLRHAGEELADDGEQHGGWALRRSTGGELEPTRSLSVQGVRDGEVLFLAPRRLDWPELAYDDVVEVIASGARRIGRSWGNGATRRCALAVTTVLLGLGVLELLLAGPPWGLPGAAGLGIATVLVIVGIVLARAAADADAGAAVAGAALPYAFAGGLVVTAPPDVPLTHLGAPHLLVASAALVAFGIAGSVGVAGAQRVFIAAAGTGAAGALAALLCLAGASAAGAAGVAMTVMIGLLPGYPLIASWLGRLPVPPLPDKPHDILADRPAPKRSVVFAAVARSHELLSGMLLAAAVVSAAGTVVLVLNRSVAGALLCLAAAVALLLRGRLFPTPVQRVPMLVSGLASLVLLAFGPVLRTSPGPLRLLPLLLFAVAAALVLASGLAYSRRAPSPYVGRLADIFDVLAIMALIPLACAVLGVFDAIQGLFASVG
jgi:type VII secretion integral membrane protein EccD